MEWFDEFDLEENPAESKFSVVESGGKLQVTTPYHPDFVAEAKKLNARWDPSSRVWIFDARDRTRVEKILADVFGVRLDEPVRTVTVRVTLQEGGNMPLNPLWGFGRLIAERKFRDWPVKLGPGVIIAEGEFYDSAGSRRDPILGPMGKVVLEIRDVPEILVNEKNAPRGYKGPLPFEIVETGEDPGRRRKELAEERDRLMARLREIEELLSRE